MCFQTMLTLWHEDTPLGCALIANKSPAGLYCSVLYTVANLFLSQAEGLTHLRWPMCLIISVSTATAKSEDTLLSSLQADSPQSPGPTVEQMTFTKCYFQAECHTNRIRCHGQNSLHFCLFTSIMYLSCLDVKPSWQLGVLFKVKEERGTSFSVNISQSPAAVKLTLGRTHRRVIFICFSFNIYLGFLSYRFGWTALELTAVNCGSLKAV